MGKIEFIIPTYNRPDNLMVVLMSIKVQTSNDWKVHVVADAIYDGYQEVKDYFKNDDRFRFSELNGPHKDWGHTARNYGLEMAEEEWVVMSGDDNYYMPVFVKDFLEAGKNHGVHFVYCNLIHNWVYDLYIALISGPKIGQIDIGNFMAKTKFAKQLKLDMTRADADGVFVEEYLRKFKGNIIKLDKFLYVHN